MNSVDENQNKQPSEEEIKKAQEQEAGKNTAHTAGKAAATYFGGAAGNKIYDLASRTKLGQGIENAAGKIIQHSPAKHLANLANKSGALNVANQAIDSASGDVKGSLSKGGTVPKGSATQQNSLGSQETLEKEGINKETLAREGLTEQYRQQANNGKRRTEEKSGNQQKSENSSQETSSGEATVKKISKVALILTGILPCGCIFGFVALTILVPIVAILAPAMGVINFFSGLFSDVNSDEAIAKAEQEYYEALAEAQENAYQKYGVCIDVNLIHATLTVNKLSDDSLEEGEELCDDLESCNSEAQDLFSVSEYKKMEKQIDLLANMQIKRKKYSLMKAECYPDTAIDRCVEGHGSAETIPVTAENKDCIDEGFLAFIDATLSGLPSRDSSSPRLVARNDKENTLFTSFLVKQASKEKNYEYFLYIPEAKYEDRDKDGVAETRVCDEEHLKNSVPNSSVDFAQLDVGSWEDMTNNVYFYNLLDSFVEDYYSDYLTKESGYAEEGTKRYEDAKDLIDDIYALYDIMGPNRNCDFAYQPSVSGSCPNGVTVTGGEYAGTYDLEEYVAGVVEAEMYSDFNIEAKKALAVAARTYVLNRTNYCENPIENSSNAQNFNPNYSDESWEAASSTAGEVLTYSGEIFSSEYDSWNCQGSNTCTYVKLPNRESNEITISDKYLSRAAGGHGRGMSQIAAADMAASSANTGSTYYRTILSTFYSEGVQISVLGGSGSSLDPSIVNASKDEKLKYLFPDGLPTSSSEMSRYLTTISITAPDATGTNHTFTTQVHKAVASDIQNAMQEIVNAGFPINSFYCYSWRGMAGNRNTTSHHSYGVACDINPTQNYMIRNGQVISGSYWKPGKDPYSITSNGIVVTTFAKYGWIWGGSWSSSKDYMHFSFTGY